jgi:desulfoferrodoxin-like iron-binding protein
MCSPGSAGICLPLSIDAPNALALYCASGRRSPPSNYLTRRDAYVANQVGKRYQCTKCGTEMIVTKAGDGEISCCGQPMQQKQ